MPTVKIARRAYQRVRQSALADFAENVFKRMNGVVAYKDLDTQVKPLGPLFETYQTSLAAARNRGRSEVVAKNLAQDALVQQLDKIANALDSLDGDNTQLIVDAGFTLQQGSAIRYADKLPAPIILRASSTGKKGAVRVTVDDLVARGAVATHALEYSTNREEGWINGTYHSHRNFTVEGLPRVQELWIRTRSIGHGDNKSEWSEPVVVAVL